ncbi:Nuclear pore complex protein like [Actinidia chinensis var. chinensis]|uniref:Nuclear pore complex protein like n=1 Tax=Actinidia chinensis var. chinensis TaxID=1590841 RepID=A0A2R6Q897_ACTCC|nr:Nuclear pore complex protein like [Actinidia chinensis var. chinensis]
MAGSPFDVHRAEPSQQQSVRTPPLDMRQAELSRQHVRALNTQFASWVQTQLQNHPDELWEDGARDYLAHASNIMEKFKDVVSWLKSNTANGESFSGLGSHTAPKKFVSESKDNPIKSFQEKTGFAQAASSASFVPSWSSGDLFSSQTAFTFGSQSPAPLNNEASNDEDGEELQQPSSPSVKKAEEKGVIVAHEVKCKLYVKSSDPDDKGQWKDKGTGQLSIKCKEGISKGTRESKPTILVRNDVGKVLLNALLYPGIKTNMQKNSIVAIFHTTPDGGNDNGENNVVVARTFLIRTKTEEDRNKLATAIQEYAPAA